VLDGSPAFGLSVTAFLRRRPGFSTRLWTTRRFCGQRRNAVGAGGACLTRPSSSDDGPRGGAFRAADRGHERGHLRRVLDPGRRLDARRDVDGVGPEAGDRPGHVRRVEAPARSHRGNRARVAASDQAKGAPLPACGPSIRSASTAHEASSSTSRSLRHATARTRAARPRTTSPTAGSQVPWTCTACSRRRTRADSTSPGVGPRKTPTRVTNGPNGARTSAACARSTRRREPGAKMTPTASTPAASTIAASAGRVRPQTFTRTRSWPPTLTRGPRGRRGRRPAAGARALGSGGRDAGSPPRSRRGRRRRSARGRRRRRRRRRSRRR
jgi:hypothetical protein